MQVKQWRKKNFSPSHIHICLSFPLSLINSSRNVHHAHGGKIGHVVFFNPNVVNLSLNPSPLSVWWPSISFPNLWICKYFLKNREFCVKLNNWSCSPSLSLFPHQQHPHINYTWNSIYKFVHQRNNISKLTNTVSHCENITVLPIIWDCTVLQRNALLQHRWLSNATRCTVFFHVIKVQFPVRYLYGDEMF